jgi:hypothetical protein
MLCANAQHNSMKYADFTPQSYCSLHIGTNCYAGEFFFSNIADALTKGLGLKGRFSLGYDFSPVFGGRVTFLTNTYKWVMNAETIRKFISTEAGVELTYNLTNVIYDYNPSYPYEFLLYGGVSVSTRQATDLIKQNLLCLPVKGGVQFNYKIGRYLNFNALAELSVLKDTFNGLPVSGIDGGTPFDLSPALMLGLTYYLSLDRDCKCYY